MAMPQVHIVSLCTDLGYGTARGAEMLSVMLAAGVVSRLGFGWLVDRIGPLPTFLISSALQALSLLLFLPSELAAVAVHGVGTVRAGPGRHRADLCLDHPAATIRRRGGDADRHRARGDAGRHGAGRLDVGAIFDLTLSYDLAFLNGFFWNLVNLAIAVFLLMRLGRRTPLMLRTAA